MSLLQLVLKQMRQRALSTWLTLLSVLLGVGLATAILLFQREGRKLFGQTDFGCNVLIGPKGNKLQLVLNTIYHMSQSPGTIPYSYYEKFPSDLPPQMRGAVQWKLPIAVGDNYKGHRIVGTLTSIFGTDEQGKPLPPERVPEYRAGRHFELADGRPFHPRKFEAVIGWEVAQRAGLQIGSTFKAEHGMGGNPSEKDEHDEKWTVVGVLKQTHTANDRVLFIPLVSFYAIPEHERGLEEIAGVAGTQPAAKPAAHHEHHGADDHDEAYELNPDGTIELKLPKDQWRVSAVLTRAKGVWGIPMLWAVDNGNVAMAVNPAMEMQTFFDTFLKGSSDLLLLVSVLVTVVAAVSILVSIYNSISARKKDIAILRALGATRTLVLATICLEAGLIGLVGGIGGLLAGHLLGAGGSVYLQRLVGEGIRWFDPAGAEWLYLGGVVCLAVLAGLVPAAKAYSTPVATNLVAA